VVTIDLNYDLSPNAQVCLGYGYYLRKASLQEQHFREGKTAFRAMYILRF